MARTPLGFGRVSRAPEGLELPEPRDKSLARTCLLRDRLLSKSAKAVGEQLVDRFNIKSGRCDPSINRLQKDTGYGRRTIFKALKELQKAGYITIRRHGGGSQTNAYAINWERMRMIALGKHETGVAGCTVSGAQAGHQTGAQRGTQTIKGTIEVEPLARGDTKRGPTTRIVRRQTPQVAVKTTSRKPLPSSSQVMRNKAQQRWEKDLMEALGGCFAQVLDQITPEIAEAATQAEINVHGSGHLVVLEAL